MSGGSNFGQSMNQTDIQDFLQGLQSQVNGDALDEVVACCSFIQLTRGAKLIETGKRHPFLYLIVQGSAKSYYLSEGKEVCTWFAFEGEVVSTMSTFAGHPSNETVELLEDAALIRIHVKDFKALSVNRASVARLITEWVVEHAIFLESLLYLQSLPVKMRYEHILEARPEILQRVSLTDLASFLGMSRESLSRIRSAL